MDLDWSAVPVPRAQAAKMSPTAKRQLDKRKKGSISIIKHAAKDTMVANAQTSAIDRVNQKSPIKLTTLIHKTRPKTSSLRPSVQRRSAQQSKQKDFVKKDAVVKTGKRRPSTLCATSRSLKQMRSITVGSDCTGLGTDEIAMRRVLGLDCHNMFASEINAVARRLLVENAHRPAKVYQDITSVARRGAPFVDVYTAGFPCQPYSAAGLNLGMEDPRCVVSSVINYIKTKLPTLFVLENVKNILSKRHKARSSPQQV